MTDNEHALETQKITFSRKRAVLGFFAYLVLTLIVAVVFLR
jgi:hypothetical protein